MRPLPCPGLRWAWRTSDTLQFGVDVPHPVIIAGLPPVSRALLSSLDGVRTEGEVIAHLVAVGEDTSEGADSAAVLRQLIDLGVLVDGGRWPGELPSAPTQTDRWLPDLRSASALKQWSQAPVARWDILSKAQVTVAGASRLGATIARALSAGGVGRVEIDDSGQVSAADLSVGGFSVDDIGRRRAELLATDADQHSPFRARGIERRLVVVTDAVEAHPRCRALAAAGTAHLVVSCQELIGRVGPLVLPGRSACQFCLELARRDIDAHWADIWRQQTVTPTPDADSVLVAITAHVAAAHILNWLTDGQPASVGGFVEVTAPDGAATLHHLWRHPECGCMWP